MSPTSLLITAETVARYLQLGDQIDTLTKERAMLRDNILTALDSGHPIAPDSPWELYKSVSDRAAVPWREVAGEWIKRVVGDRWTREVEKLEARHRTQVTQLLKRPNGRFLAAG